jgi:hypothetical protein
MLISGEYKLHRLVIPYAVKRLLLNTGLVPLIVVFGVMLVLLLGTLVVLHVVLVVNGDFLMYVLVQIPPRAVSHLLLRPGLVLSNVVDLLIIQIQLSVVVLVVVILGNLKNVLAEV